MFWLASLICLPSGCAGSALSGLTGSGKSPGDSGRDIYVRMRYSE